MSDDDFVLSESEAQVDDEEDSSMEFSDNLESSDVKPARNTKRKPAAAKPAETKKPKKAAPAATKENQKPLSESQSRALILEYMVSQNRPYSHQNVFDNLHGKVKKASVPKILDALADAGKLVRKDFGKAKIYLADQSQYPPVSQEEVTAQDQVIADLKEQVNQAKERIASISGEVNKLTSEPADGELDTQLEATRNEVLPCLKSFDMQRLTRRRVDLKFVVNKCLLSPRRI
jgi:Fe2+ or Zn2+ uptake regulation protein